MTFEATNKPLRPQGSDRKASPGAGVTQIARASGAASAGLSDGSTVSAAQPLVGVTSAIVLSLKLVAATIAVRAVAAHARRFIG